MKMDKRILLTGLTEYGKNAFLLLVLPTNEGRECLAYL